MKIEISKDFVLEAHKAACRDWKKRIEKELPELFIFRWEKGKWYRLSWGCQSVAYVNSDGTNDSKGATKGFGIRNGGLWEGNNNVFWGGSTDVKKELMTHIEIEEMLWKEAEKIDIGKDTKIEYSVNKPNESWYNQGLMIPEYIFGFDELWNKNGCIYKQGKWAKPLDENKEIKETISRLEKEIEELKLKVK